MIKKRHFLYYSFLLLFFIQSTATEARTADTASINRRIEYVIKNIYTLTGVKAETIDSILTESISIHYDHGIFMAYNMKGSGNLMSGNLDDAQADYRNAAKYIDEKKKPRNLVINLSNRALLYRQQYKFDSSESYYKLAIEKANKYHFDNLHRKFLSELGIVYKFKNDYINAYKSFTEARDLSIRSKDSVTLANTYISLGLIYQDLAKYQQSILLFHKARAIAKKTPSLHILAQVYNNLGEVYADVQNHDSAIYYYYKTIESAMPYERDRINLTSLVNIGNLFLEKDIFDSCFYYYNKAFESPEISNFPDINTAVLVNLGSSYLMVKDYKNARKFLESGYEASNKYDLLQYKKNALEALIMLDSIQGNYKDALSNFSIYKQVSDSLNAEKVSNQIAALEFDKMLALKKYDNKVLLQENKMKNELINTQQRILIIIIIALVLMLISFYFVILNRKKVRTLANELTIKNDKLRQVKINLENKQLDLETQQSALKELNKSKDKFLSILSHDLKGPISGFNELLMTMDEQWADFSDNEKHHLILLLKDSSTKTYKLLEDLLDWGKATNGKITPEFKNLNVKELTHEVVKLFESKLSKKNIHLELNISDDFEVINDARLLSQVVQNFVNNAIKYTYPGGKITIASKTDKNSRALCVTDTGIGIPTEVLPKLFDLGETFNRPGTENEKSSGMGLTLCKEYARLMQLEIKVESTENVGSSFCLIFK